MRSWVVGLAVVCCALSWDCSDESPTRPGVQTNTLVFTRADGSSVTFGSTTLVWCGPWESGEVEEPAVHVRVGGASSGWQLQAVRRDIRVGEALSFPNTFIWNEPRNADFFIYDPPNELSTQTDASNGSIVFEKLDCSTGGAIRFTIDAVVGSEFGDGPPLVVTGTFEGKVGNRP